jgi:hypothetical protein
VVLIIFTLSVPFVFAAFIDNTIVAALASLAAVQTYIMMNEVANDVEDPFHYDPNQLPLPQMQYRLNERLLAVSKTERPLAFTDIGAIDGPSNIPQLPPVRPCTGPSSGPCGTEMRTLFLWLLFVVSGGIFPGFVGGIFPGFLGRQRKLRSCGRR